ncbi:MAG: hypothetical protein K2W96_27800, partial [Gemmataceae bacterium]|nr:hypothetical protein [Gemmataceae bacterium]
GSGAAYLTRPEGLLVAACAGLVLLFQRRRRAAACLAVPLLAVSLPYMAAIGGLTVKPSAGIMKDPDAFNHDGHWAPQPKKAAAVVAAPLPLAMWWIGPDVRPGDRWGWAGYALARCADEAFFPGGLLLVALGAWLWRGRFRADAGFAFVALLAAVMAALCYRLAQSNGYLSGRHLLMPALPGLGFLVVGVAWLARRPAVSAAVLGAVMLACAPKTLAPLHADRAAYRQAGEWLAAHASPEDDIHDPYAHAYYHAGWVFTEGKRPAPFKVRYAVLDESSTEHQHLDYLVRVSRDLKAAGAVKVASFPLGRRGKKKGDVAIYRWGG